MSADVHEDLIRDFLAERIESLPDMISNRESMEKRLRDAEAEFFNLPSTHGGPTASDLMRRLLSKRNLRGLELLYNLRLVGKDIPLLNTGKVGFQPSADLLAMNTEMGTLFLGEVKRGHKTEREAITELSAYSQGLQQRFWGLNGTDVVWVPIAEEFRVTVAAGFAFQMFCSNAACLPMKATVKTKDGVVEDVSLELVDLAPEIPEEFGLSLFAWDCFDGMTFNFAQELPEPEALMEFITATASRMGFSGFVLFTEPTVPTRIPFPYGILMGVYNPFKGFLKRLQLGMVGKAEGVEAMRREVKKPLWHGHDYDVAKAEEYWHRFDFFAEDKESEDDDRVSLEELAGAASNRTSWLWNEILPRLKMFTNHVEPGTPSIGTLLHDSDYLGHNTIRRVSYFGLMQEAVFERLRYEHHNAKGADGPVMGDIGVPWSLYSNPALFSDFMGLMNYEHEYQPESYEDEEGDEPAGEEAPTK